MKRRFEFREWFEQDVQEQGDWLEERAPGMGEQFVQAVNAALRSLEDRPKGHQYLRPPYRRVLILRFKVLIPYRLFRDRIRVLGVVHGARDLSRWLSNRVAGEEE